MEVAPGAGESLRDVGGILERLIAVKNVASTKRQQGLSCRATQSGPLGQGRSATGVARVGQAMLPWARAGSAGSAGMVHPPRRSQTNDCVCITNRPLAPYP